MAGLLAKEWGDASPGHGLHLQHAQALRNPPVLLCGHPATYLHLNAKSSLEQLYVTKPTRAKTKKTPTDAPRAWTAGNRPEETK
jgi:hypothetical protein